MAIKQYDPEGVAEFLKAFIEDMKVIKLELPRISYKSAKDQVLDGLSDELQISKKDFIVLMSGLEVISDWEDWFQHLT